MIVNTQSVKATDIGRGMAVAQVGTDGLIRFKLVSRVELFPHEATVEISLFDGEIFTIGERERIMTVTVA